MIKLKEQRASIGTLTIDEILEPIRDLISFMELERGSFYKHRVIWMDDKVEYAHLRYDGPHDLTMPDGEIRTMPLFTDVNRELSRSGYAKEVILVS